MQTNIEVMHKIANKTNFVIKAKKMLELVDFSPVVKEVKQFTPRNYCDDDLANLYNPKDWFEDKWWRI